MIGQEPSYPILNRLEKKIWKLNGKNTQILPPKKWTSEIVRPITSVWLGQLKVFF